MSFDDYDNHPLLNFNPLGAEEVRKLYFEVLNNRLDTTAIPAQISEYDFKVGDIAREINNMQFVINDMNEAMKDFSMTVKTILEDAKE